MQKRTSQGRWYNTQDNTFALLAIDRYFNQYEKNIKPNFTASVLVNEFLVAQHKYYGFTTDQNSTKIPNRIFIRRNKYE